MEVSAVLRSARWPGKSLLISTKDKSLGHGKAWWGVKSLVRATRFKINPQESICKSGVCEAGGVKRVVWHVANRCWKIGSEVFIGSFTEKSPHPDPFTQGRSRFLGQMGMGFLSQKDPKKCFHTFLGTSGIFAKGTGGPPWPPIDWRQFCT